jgi:GT2 family glycosyltransferase
LLNSDTVMTESALEAMVAHLDSHREIGLVGPALLNLDGSPQPSRMQFPFWSRSMRRIAGAHLRDASPESPLCADWLVGACLVLRRTVLTGVGGMDEAYPFYGEDMDLAYRIHRAGLEVVWLPSARIHHVAEGSSHFPPSPAMRVRSWYEAPLRFLLKHGTLTDILWWRLTRGVAASLRYARTRWMRHGTDPEQQLAIWSGVLQLCLRGEPATWSLDTNH